MKREEEPGLNAPAADLTPVLDVAAAPARAPVYEFEYRARMNELPDCPCVLTGAYSKVGYRMVRADLKDPCNFHPMALIDPLGYARNVPQRQCAWWGLSMFEHPDALRRRFTKAKLSSPQIEKRIGSHYVGVMLDNTKGRISSSADNGHFEFFPYRGFDGEAASIEHLKLYP